MIKHLACVLAALLGLFALPARADLKVFATVPEWAALAQEIGGDKVDVFAATQGLQDPHHVQAKPSLIARAAQCRPRRGDRRRAGDRLAAAGACAKPATRRIQPDQPGYFEAARSVHMLDVPEPPRPRRGRRPCRRQSAHPDRPAQFPGDRCGPGQAHGRTRRRQRRRLPGRLQALRRALERRPAALAGGGGAAARRRRGDAAQGLSPISTTGSA